MNSSRMTRLRQIGPRHATHAWLWLLCITVLCAALAVTERGLLPWVGWGVAALVWVKAWLVADHYLEVADAAPVFRRIVHLFIAVVPLALVITAWLEAAR